MERCTVKTLKSKRITKENKKINKIFREIDKCSNCICFLTLKHGANHITKVGRSDFVFRIWPNSSLVTLLF